MLVELTATFVLEQLPDLDLNEAHPVVRLISDIVSLFFYSLHKTTVGSMLYLWKSCQMSVLLIMFLFSPK